MTIFTEFPRWLMNAKRFFAFKAVGPKWSEDVLADIDKQYRLWSAVHSTLVHNNQFLGTPQMVRYSDTERRELEILLQNMEQLASFMKTGCNKKIVDLYQATQHALNDYDEFFALKNQSLS